MHSSFSLFRNHLEAARFFWLSHMNNHPGNVLDATLGNGKDLLFLAKTLLQEQCTHTLFGIDVQEKSLIQTEEALQKELPQHALNRITLLHGCHSKIDFSSLAPLSLVIYNLGYLPGSDKVITTCSTTTLLSLQLAMTALCSFGLITITCYPGHEEGKRESDLLRNFLWTLPKAEWSIVHLEFSQENTLAPSLWIIQKAGTTNIQEINRSCTKRHKRS